MPRPSSDSDKKLIQAALELLDQTGFSGLKLRQVAAKAKVNLGMFHYHFKTKEDFEAKVLEAVYESMFSKLSLESTGPEPGLERLRKALFTFGQFTRQHRRIVLGLLHDAMNGHKGILQFAQKNFPRHIKVLVDLIQECQQQGSLEKSDPMDALIFLMSAINLANAISGILEKTEEHKLFSFKLKLIQSRLISDQAIQRRVDLALKALSPAKGA